MVILVLLGAALPVVTVFLLLRATRWDRHGERAAPAFIAALALGLGNGIAACAYFLSLVIFDGARAGVIAIDATLLLVALAVFWWRRAPQAAHSASPWTLRDRVLLAALVVVALAAAAGFVANTLDSPHGRWDAWATWNIRARWLVRAGPAWRTAFAAPTVHGDYPLLLPAAVARLWTYGGTESTIIPAAMAATYAVAIPLLLYGALATVRGRTQGLLGALCLCSTPLFMRHAAWQYADMPLAFNYLAAIALLGVRDHDSGCDVTALAWAGLAAGLAAWTKNEGMLFVACIVAARSVLAAARRQYAVGSGAWFLAGLLPAAVVVIGFKGMAPPGPRSSQRLSDMLPYFADPSRYAAILRETGTELARGGGPLLIALALYAVVLGRARDERARGAAQGVVLVVALVAVVYGAVYMTTRADVTWHLSHSVDRLILQLWPSALLAFLLYIASPSEVAPVTAPTSRPARRRAARKSR
jgi:hypothetical protein